MFSCLQQAEERNFFTSFSWNLGFVDLPIPVHTFCAPFLHLHLGNPLSPSKADLDGYKYEKIGYKDIFTACIIC